MLELVRTFLGYCINCRLPKIVGEFKLLGWKHTFNMCDQCMQTQTERLRSQAALEITQEKYRGEDESIIHQSQSNR